jgi:hypothetical protein
VLANFIENRLLYLLIWLGLLAAGTLRLLYFAFNARRGTTIPLEPWSWGALAMINAAHTGVPVFFIWALLGFSYMWTLALFGEVLNAGRKHDWTKVFTVLKWTFIGIGAASLVISLVLSMLYLKANQDTFTVSHSDPARLHIIYWLFVASFIPVVLSFWLFVIAVYVLYRYSSDDGMVQIAKERRERLLALRQMIVAFFLLFAALLTRAIFKILDNVPLGSDDAGLNFGALYLGAYGLLETIPIAIIAYFLFVGLRRAHSLERARRSDVPVVDNSLEAQRQRLIDDHYDE